MTDEEEINNMCKSIENYPDNRTGTVDVDAIRALKKLVCEYKRVLKQRNSLRDAFLNKEIIDLDKL